MFAIYQETIAQVSLCVLFSQAKTWHIQTFCKHRCSLSKPLTPLCVGCAWAGAHVLHLCCAYSLESHSLPTTLSVSAGYGSCTELIEDSYRILIGAKAPCTFVYHKSSIILRHVLLFIFVLFCFVLMRFDWLDILFNLGFDLKLCIQFLLRYRPNEIVKHRRKENSCEA